MGTVRVHGDCEGAWGLGGCMGTGRVHGDWEGALSCLLMDGFTMYEDGEEERFVLRDKEKYGGTGEECG